MDEYVPWPPYGCDLASAVGRLAAGISSNIERAKKSCHRHLLCGDLIAYGRAARVQGAASQLITPGTWTSLTIDSRLANAVGSNGIEISEIRIFPPVISPCRVEILDQMPIADAFRRFVLNDPEVTALAAAALPLAPKWESFFREGKSMFAAAGDWPVNLDSYWFAKPIHPDPKKRSVFERPDDPDPLEVVIAVEALKHRYRSLMSMLQQGAMVARGITARTGFTETIVRSVWSHEAFQLRVSTGDVLQDNEYSVDQFDRTLKNWVGVVLCKPAASTTEADWNDQDGDPTASMFHVNNTGSDHALLNAAAPTAEKKAKGRIETEARSYRECVAWLVQIMRASPKIRTATIAVHWAEARTKWPVTLSRRSFEKARSEAIKEAKAYAWTAAGRSKKLPQEKSPR